MSRCRSLVARACSVLAATLVVGGVAFVPLLLVGAAPAGASPLVPTDSNLSSSANPAGVGQPVTLTDTVGASLYGTSVVPDNLATLVGSGLDSPELIAMDATGNIYFAGSSGNEVSVLPIASGSLYGVPVSGGTLATLVSSGLDDPIGVAVDPAGNLYISNYGNDTVSVLPAASGTLFGQSVSAGVLATLVPAASGLSQPEGIAFDAGNLYIAERTGAIAVLPAAGGTLFGTAVTADTLTPVVSTGLSTDYNVAFDAAGNLYIANQGTGSVLVLPVASGALFGTPVTADTLATVISGLNTPVGLALDSSGDLYVSDYGAATVSVLPAASGTLFGTPVTAGALATLVSSGLQGPTGLALDGQGDLYIADYTGSDMDVLPTVMGTLPASGETVDFQDGGTDIPGCQAVELTTTYPDVATCATSFSGPGTQSITATYSGDSNFAGSTAAVLSLAVYGNELYAARAALGAGDCSDAANACTIWTALNGATVSGDTIDLASGTYDLWDTLDVSLAGSLNFQAEAGATPVLDGQGLVQVMNIAAGSSVTLTGVTVENGYSSSGGGGIYNAGSVLVQGSTITGNTDATSASSTAGGGLANAGQATVVNSTFSGNTESNNSWGGAISNQAGSTLNVIGSTFSGNEAAGGCACGAAGAIANFGTATFVGSTFWDNVTNGGDGGAIETQGALTIIGDTFAGGNKTNNLASGGGDVFDQSGATVNSAGNVFADTSSDPCYIQAGSTWDDDGYNAAGSGTQCLGAATDVTDAALPGDLGTLAANGGGTDTVLPNASAPEVGAVPDPTGLVVDSSPVTLCPVTDQAGALSNDEDCSIGSLFVPSAPGTPTGLSAAAVTSGVSLSWTAPVTNGTTTVTGYNIYEGTTPGGESSTPVNAAPVAGTSYAVSGLTNHGSPYYFTVAAVDGSGTSAASNEADAVPNAPASPSATTTSATATSTTLSPTTSTTKPGTNPGHTTTTTARPRTRKPTPTTTPASPTTATTIVLSTATTIVLSTTTSAPGSSTTVPPGTTTSVPTQTSVPSAPTTMPAPATTEVTNQVQVATAPVAPGQAPTTPTSPTGTVTTLPPGPLTTEAPALSPQGTPIAGDDQPAGRGGSGPSQSPPNTSRPAQGLSGSAGRDHGHGYGPGGLGTVHRAIPSPPAKVAISFHFSVGERVTGKLVQVSGQGLLAGSTVVVTLHSVPLELGAMAVGPNGRFAGTVSIPVGTPEGDHHVEVSGRGPTGAPVFSSRYFELGTSDIVTRVQPQASDGTGVPAWVSDGGPQPQVVDGKVFSAYVPAQHAKQVMPLEVGAVVLIGLAAAGGATFAAAGSGLVGGGDDPSSGPGSADSGGGPGAGDEKSKKEGKIGSAAHKHGIRTEDEKRAGDRSWTWRWPGVAKLDKISRELPRQLSRYSPLLCRVVADGAGVRAIAGTLAVLFPVAGLGLGVAAVASVGGSALPPSFGLVTAIIVLSVLDALAGVAAALAFFIGVIASGGVTSASSLRLLLAVSVLFFVAPLTASKARSLRRKYKEGMAYVVDRAGDFVIAALVAAYGVEKLVSGLKPLSTLELPVSSHAAAIAIAVLVAVIARYLMETIVVHWYPYRLSQVAMEKAPEPTSLQRHISTIFQTLLFLFVAMPVFGSDWELYAAAVVLWLSAMTAMYPGFLPDVPWVKKLVPGGWVKSVVTLVVGSALAALVAVTIPNKSEELSLGLLIFMVPGVILGLADSFARNAKKFKLDWAGRAGGFAVLVVGVLLAQGIVTLTW